MTKHDTSRITVLDIERRNPPTYLLAHVELT
jgi:hypothetical protein